MINDTVYVHGGLSEKYSLWPIQKLNDRYRLELADMQLGSLSGRSPVSSSPKSSTKVTAPFGTGTWPPSPSRTCRTRWTESSPISEPDIW